MEQFVNDGSPMSTVIKSLKRYMAGEHSRVLSEKVFAGQCRLIELGYRQGGMAGYGLRRMRIDQYREPQGVLDRGQRKSLQTDRVILVPGTGRGSADRSMDVPAVHRRRQARRRRSPRCSTSGASRRISAGPGRAAPSTRF